MGLTQFSEFTWDWWASTASGHEHTLRSPLGVNATGLRGNWFWRVRSVAGRFYCLETSSKGSSLKRFLTLSKKKFGGGVVYIVSSMITQKKLKISSSIMQLMDP